MTLNRTQVVEAATKLLQEQSRTELSMRNLAARLNVSTMALYNHVSDRQDLTDAVVEQHWARLELNADLVVSAHSYYHALRQNPWLVPLYRSTRSEWVAADMAERLALDDRRSITWLALSALAAGLAEYEAAGHAPGTDWGHEFTHFAESIVAGPDTPGRT